MPCCQQGPVEGMAAPSGGGTIPVFGQVSELDAVVGQHGVDLIRDGRHHLIEEGLSRRTRGFFHQSGEGKLRGPVHRHEEIELAFLGADLSNIDVKLADRVALEGLPGGLVAGDLGQTADPVALQAAVQGRTREMRDRRL